MLVSSSVWADLLIKVEGGLAVPVSAPARDYFGVGFHVGAAVSWDLVRYLDVGLSLDYLFASRVATSPLPGPASVLSVGPTVRVHAPWSDSKYLPWGSVGLQYARTGSLDRLAFSAALGLEFPIANRAVFIGPWFGLQQVFQDAPRRVTMDMLDVTSLIGGICVEFPAYRQATDRDHDGVLDGNDACPDLAGTGPDGCPPPVVTAPPDPDGDGIVGAADRCPLQAEDRDGFSDEDGCPDPDDDGDGVLDTVDACPRLAGPAATHGCPDTDKDGVADNDDRCPTVKGLASEQGCPVYKSVKVTAEKIEIDQKIFFAFGTTFILHRSFPILDEVVMALRDRERLCVRIEGHTDSVGKSDANLTLSQGRVGAVRDYLVKNGVGGVRLQARGYGSMLPLDSNATPEGRERNRRVEFVIVPCPENMP